MKFLWKCNYTASGMKGVLQEGGNARRSAAEKLVKSAGGTLETFYFAFGDADLYAIADFPDAAACASAAMQVSAAGGVTVATTVLITPDEVDQAAQMDSVDYRPPGA